MIDDDIKKIINKNQFYSQGLQNYAKDISFTEKIKIKDLDLKTNN